MLERIDITIFDVARLIGLVADQMLPETPLPDSALVAREANGAAPLLFRQRFREPGLDQPPGRNGGLRYANPPYELMLIGGAGLLDLLLQRLAGGGDFSPVAT